MATRATQPVKGDEDTKLRRASYIAEITKAMNARKAKRLEEALSPHELGELSSGDRIVALLKQGLLDNIPVAYATHRNMDVLPGVVMFVHIFSDRGAGNCTYSIRKMAKFLSRSENAVREALKRAVDAGLLERHMPAAGSGYSHWPVVFKSILDPSSSPAWFVDAALSSDDTPQGNLGGDGTPTQVEEYPSSQLEGTPQSQAGDPLKPTCNVYSRGNPLEGISTQKAVRDSADVRDQGSPPSAAMIETQSKPEEAAPAPKRKRAILREKPTSEQFDRFWKAYPRRVGKANAREHFMALKPADAEMAILGAQKFAEECRRKRTEEKYIKCPQGWLSEARFEDYEEQIEAERRKAWESSIVAYMMGGDWSPPDCRADCPAPGTEGFPMSIEQTRDLVRPRSRYEDLLKDYASGVAEAEAPFNSLRPEIFDDGERERLVEAHREAQERSRQERERQRQAIEERCKRFDEEMSARKRERLAKRAAEIEGRKRVAIELEQRRLAIIASGKSAWEL